MSTDIYQKIQNVFTRWFEIAAATMVPPPRPVYLRIKNSENFQQQGNRKRARTSNTLR